VSVRAVVCASSEVGVVCLTALLELGADAAAVLTHADDPDERQWFRSVAALARAGGLPVFSDERLDTPAWLARRRGAARSTCTARSCRATAAALLREIYPRLCDGTAPRTPMDLAAAGPTARCACCACRGGGARRNGRRATGRARTACRREPCSDDGLDRRRWSARRRPPRRRGENVK